MAILAFGATRRRHALRVAAWAVALIGGSLLLTFAHPPESPRAQHTALPAPTHAEVRSPFAPERDETVQATNFGVITQLLGVRVAAEPRASGAVVMLADGSERAFAVGRDIAPGITLASVSDRSITLVAQDGGTQVLALAERPPPGASTAFPQQSPPSEGDDPARWLTALMSQPHEMIGDASGWRVAAPVHGAAAHAGLAPGDMILSVNGCGPTETRTALLSLREALLTLEVLRADGSRATLVVPQSRPS